MRYQDFLSKEAFSKAEILAFARNGLIDDWPDEDHAMLPAPPFLMFDRILTIEHQGRRGRIVAEQDVQLDAWFFQCHFRSDPVQPGCLGVDAVWQLLGFYNCVRGALGAGRALGSKEIEFYGQVRPHDNVVRYEVDVRRFSEFPQNQTAVSIGTGKVFVDGEEIYTVTDAKVGMFRGIAYADYPAVSEHAKGGRIKK